MSRDWSAEIQQLRNDKAQWKANKAEKVARFEAEWTAKKNAALAEVTLEDDVAYARQVKRWAESGVPQGVIRRALGLTTWDDWVRIRDLGGLDPVRSVQAAMRDEKVTQERGYKVEGDTLTVYRGKRGTLSHPEVFYDVFNPNINQIEQFRDENNRFTFDATHYDKAWFDCFAIIHAVQEAKKKESK